MAFPATPVLGTSYNAPGGQSWTFNADGAWERASDGATVPAAVMGLNVKPGGLVMSSDGIMMINNTGATIAITALTRAGLKNDGLIELWKTMALPSSLGGTITATPALTIQTGVANSNTLAASNGVAPTTWSVLTGVLPAGLTLNAATGVISGTPTGTAGSTYSFTIRGTDANSDYNDQAYSGSILGTLIAGGSMLPTTTTITNGLASTTTFAAAGGSAPYTYAVQAGALPAGLTLNTATGALTGTPTGAVTTAYNFTIRATDSASNYFDKVYSGAIVANTPPAVYPNKTIFNYTGADQTFTIPPGTSWVKVKAWGGGSRRSGGGGFVSGNFGGLAGALTIVVGATSGGYGNKSGSGAAGLSGAFTSASFATALSADVLLVAGGSGSTGVNSTRPQNNGGGAGGVNGFAGNTWGGAGGAGGGQTGGAATFLSGAGAGGGAGGSGYYGGGAGAGTGGGGGGSSYVSTSATGGVNTASVGGGPGNTTDVDYNGTAGKSGNWSGNSGLVVVEWG